jgi:hypothetical protein
MALQDNDRPLDGAIRAALLRADAKADACPSPDAFAAYYEHSLDPEETALYDKHFAGCESCRQILAGVARANASNSGALSDSSSGWAWLKKTTWLVPATAIAAVFAVLLTVELFPHRKPATAPAAQVAQVQPVPQAASSQAPASAPEPAATRDTEARSELKSTAPAPAPPQAKLRRNDELAPRPQLPRVAAPEVRAPKSDSYSNAPLASAPGAASAMAQSRSALKKAAPMRSVPQSGFGAGVAPPSSSASVTVTSEANLATGGEAVVSGRIVIASPDAGIVWTIFPGGRVDFSGNTANSAVHDFLPTTNPIAAGSSPGGKVCWLVGTAGTILRATDGRNWVVVPPPANADFTAVQATGASSATVTAADGGKFSTVNAGQSWKAPN